MRIPEDSEIRINNKECRGIIFKENKVLLMFRIKNGKEYYTLPGGHMRIDEEPIETAIREVKEETTIEVKDLKPAFTISSYLKKTHFDYYFVGMWKSGEPTLSGEESRESSNENFYKPMWMDIKDLESLTLYPLMAKDWISEYLKENN